MKLTITYSHEGSFNMMDLEMEPSVAPDVLSAVLCESDLLSRMVKEHLSVENPYLARVDLVKVEITGMACPYCQTTDIVA